MMPEPFVVQAIASSLGHCPSWSVRPCRAVDLGGNLGIHTAYMASLGAFVDVIEPQKEMAENILSTVRANCWSHRVAVRHAAISAREEEEGSELRFPGGWRLDDRRMRRRKAETVPVATVQKLLRGRRIELLKIDIDNSLVESALLAAVLRLVASGEADVRAIVIEVKRFADAHSPAAKHGKQRLNRLNPSLTSRRRQRGREGNAKTDDDGKNKGKYHGDPGAPGKGILMHEALSGLQRQGFHAYRLAHNIHSMGELEPWYAPCIGVRAFKYVLHVPPVSPNGWANILRLKRDTARARLKGVRTTSLWLSRDALGREAEAQWHGGGMEATMPEEWRRAAMCGGNETARAQAAERGWSGYDLAHR